MSGTRALRSVFALVIAVLVLRAVPAYASNGVDVHALAIDPLTPTTLYAGTFGGVFKSTDGGATWNVSGLVNGYISALAIDPLTPTTLYAGTSEAIGSQGGVYKSTDGGATWTAIGLAGLSVYSLAIDPLTPATLYAGTDGAVYRSLGGGAQWNATSGLIGRVSSLAIDRLTPTTLYAGTNASPLFYAWSTPPVWSGGVYKSTDGGVTWSPAMLVDVTVLDDSGGLGFSCSRCRGVLALAIDPAIPTTLFGAMDALAYWNYYGDITVWTTPGLVFKSTEISYGESYVFGGGGYDAIPINTLAIEPRTDPLAPTILYAGTYDVFKSTDGGASWSATGLTGGGDVLALAIDPRTPTILYAGTSSGGVFKSTNGGASWSPTGPITWTHLSSISLNPSSVIGGNPSTGTVTLTAAAPAGGVAVVLGADTNIVTVPASVTVAAGATSADFTVSTRPVPVGGSTLETIRGFYGGAQIVALLTVNPGATLSSFSLNPTSVPGGTASIGTVTLTAAAPPGGAEVQLTSSNWVVATVPARVIVPAGTTSADFTVSTSPVTASTSVTITAANYSARLTVTPTTTLSSLNVAPASVIGGGTSTGTVTLSGAAPAGGAVVPLASSNTAIATVPTSVTVAAGATSATFTVSTSPLTNCASSTATISATYGEVTRSAGLTVAPAVDTVAIEQADYFASRHELRVAATSTGPSVTLQVYVTSTGQLIGTLKHYDGNRYSGRFTSPVNPRNITVRSSLCGSATKVVTSK